MKFVEEKNKVEDQHILEFLSDYLVRTRQDIMEDKGVLTRMVYLYYFVYVGFFAFLKDPGTVICLSILPLLLLSIDFHHRTRFNQIFDRWNFLADKIIPKIKELCLGDITFFEELVSSRSKERIYIKLESIVRMIATSSSIIITIPIFGAYISNKAGLSSLEGAYLSIIWSSVLLVIYILVFNTKKSYSDVHLNKYAVPSVIILVVIALLVEGSLLTEWYQRATGILD